MDRLFSRKIRLLCTDGFLANDWSKFDEAEGFYAKAVSVLGSRPEAAPGLIHLGTRRFPADLSGCSVTNGIDDTLKGPYTVNMNFTDLLIS